MTDPAIPGPLPCAPLEQTYARVRDGNPYLQVLIGPQPDRETISLEAFLAADAPERDAHFAAMAEQYKTDDAEVLVRSYLGSFVWLLASMSVGPYFVARRVPVLELETLHVAISAAGSPEAIILPDTRFWCLPEDAAADHADALPVADHQDLGSLLRDKLVQFCGSLISALRPRARIGARALWICAAESCAGILIDALPRDSTVAAAEVALRTFIGQPGIPLRARPEVIMLRSGEKQRLALLGSDCCVNFRIPGEDYCSTCPHRPREERIDVLQTWLAGQSGAD
jgi:FhuF-like iron-sulfur protein